MITFGMNRWKFAKASETSDGSGQAGVEGEGDDKPVVKLLTAGSPPAEVATAAAPPPSATSHCADEPPIERRPPVYLRPEGHATAAMAQSPLMRRKGEGADPGVKKGRRLARGSQEIPALQTAANPGGDASQESQASRPRRRRKPRATRSLTRPTS